MLSGILGLILSLLLLSGSLIGLTKSLQAIFLTKAKMFIRYSTKLNGYVAILVGVGITIIVQSSSVTTSALTPLCGLGVLPLDKMLPLTLGANIGTTCTAMVAALVKLNFNSLQIAFVHLLFNIIGICIWYPIPKMRSIPLGAAKLLGLYASFYRFVPLVYIFVAFFIMPGVLLGVSAMFDVHVAAGVVLLICVLALFVVFELWWIKGLFMQSITPGCYKVLSAEDRNKRNMELEQINREILGLDDEKEQRDTETTGSDDKPHVAV